MKITLPFIAIAILTTLQFSIPAPHAATYRSHSLGALARVVVILATDYTATTK